MDTKERIAFIKEKFNLENHTEGGYFTEVYTFPIKMMEEPRRGIYCFCWLGVSYHISMNWTVKRYGFTTRVAVSG